MSKLSDEEKDFLRNTGDGGCNRAVVVVEYLQSTMSKELLGKFPDNSAFDFDYTQSAIWSPLIARCNNQDLNIELLSKTLSSSSSFSPTVLQRKLIYDEKDCDVLLENNGGNCVASSITMKKLTANLKKKISTNVFDSFKIYRDTKMKKKMKKRGIGFSPKGAANSPNPRKGWAKMLKAASGHFKRTSKKKDNCNGTHFKLSNNYLGYLN